MKHQCLHSHSKLEFYYGIVSGVSSGVCTKALRVSVQVELCQDRALDLEKLVQDPEYEGGTRVNILQSAPYNPLVLQEKLESLETSLAEKERQLLGAHYSRWSEAT